MHFSSLLGRTEATELTQEAASEMLGINVRTFQRWADRYSAEGDDGLVDRRMGRRSPKRAPEEELERMLGLYREKYVDFTVKHFHEQLQKRHNYVLGYTVTKLALHAAGLVRKAVKRGAHRKKRPRRPLRGMMLHLANGHRKERLATIRRSLALAVAVPTADPGDAASAASEAAMPCPCCGGPMIIIEFLPGPCHRRTPRLDTS